jgi:hypothetical protein
MENGCYKDTNTRKGAWNDEGGRAKVKLRTEKEYDAIRIGKIKE